MKRIFFILILALTVNYAQDESECKSCHFDGEELKSMGFEKVFIDSVLFAKSNHGEMGCLDCHDEAFNEFPHDEELKDELPTCLDCHDESGDINFVSINEQFEKSIHFEKLEGKFRCSTCHDPHEFVLTARNAEHAKEIVAYDNNVCLSCHKNVKNIQLYTERKFEKLPVIHSWLPNRELHWKSARCIDCHTDINTEGVSHLILSKDKAVKDCVECHKQETRLLKSLYKFKLDSIQRKNENGFINSFILNESYIIGATRNIILNKISIVIAGLVVALLIIHSFIRLITGRKNNGK